MGEWTKASMRAGGEGADVVIAVVSPAYAKSTNCGYEMQLAAETQTPVVPIVFGIPFSEWPPAQIGGVQLADQLRDPGTGDLKLFVDFSDSGSFRPS